MLLGGAASLWPLAVRAQKPPLPVIGFLSSASADLYTIRLRAFHNGLKDQGYVVGQNVAIEYRWAEGQNNRLPVLAAELVHRQVDVIAAGGGTPSAVAAKAATATIPIVFAVGVDPIRIGLVASLNRPGGNLTGITSLNVEVGPKRLEVLRELIPKATIIALLINPTNPSLAEDFLRALEPVAITLGLQLHVLQASTEQDFDRVFAALAQLRADALVIMPDVFYNSRSEQLAALAMRHGIPAVYQFHEFAAAGGLMSYGPDLVEQFRQAAGYVGRILKGEKPAELPVQAPTKYETVLNLRTAKALGLDVPASVLARADEVIE